jgi:hypothetical protein
MQFEGAAALRCGAAVWHQWQWQVHTGIYPGEWPGQSRSTQQQQDASLAASADLWRAQAAKLQQRTGSVLQGHQDKRCV